jgi:hypothetical protein
MLAINFGGPIILTFRRVDDGSIKVRKASYENMGFGRSVHYDVASHQTNLQLFLNYFWIDAWNIPYCHSTALKGLGGDLRAEFTLNWKYTRILIRQASACNFPIEVHIIEGHLII